jgi:hypothetical protein
MSTLLLRFLVSLGVTASRDVSRRRRAGRRWLVLAAALCLGAATALPGA